MPPKLIVYVVHGIGRRMLTQRQFSTVLAQASIESAGAGRSFTIRPAISSAQWAMSTLPRPSSG
jgi:hypothetical protein